MRARVLLSAALVLVAGCGGAATPVPVPADPTLGLAAGLPEPRGDAPDGLPSDVPVQATGPPPEAADRVVRAWLGDLTRGDLAAAGRRWALPARFGNGGPVVLVDSQLERRAVHEALPCGGRAEAVAAAGPGFVVVTIRLTERLGASCSGGAGFAVRSVVEVRDGRIRGLFRLPEGGAAPAGAPAVGA